MFPNPVPIAARPVDKAAAKYPIPLAELAVFCAVSAANAISGISPIKNKAKIETTLIAIAFFNL